MRCTLSLTAASARPTRIVLGKAPGRNVDLNLHGLRFNSEERIGEELGKHQGPVGPAGNTGERGRSPTNQIEPQSKARRQAGPRARPWTRCLRQAGSVPCTRCLRQVRMGTLWRLSDGEPNTVDLFRPGSETPHPCPLSHRESGKKNPRPLGEGGRRWVRGRARSLPRENWGRPGESSSSHLIGS